MKKTIYCLILLQLLLCFKGFSQKVVLFKGQSLNIGNEVAIFEDTSNLLDIKSIQSRPGFVVSTSQIPNLQLSKSDYWLRFSIKNVSQSELLLLELEYPTLQLCEFYYPDNGGYKFISASDTANFNERKYKHQNFIFDIHLPKDSMSTFYIRVRSSEQMVLPLKLGTPQKIFESLLTKDLFWGIFIGILIVMILYNYFVFISTRDIEYIYYVLYILFIGLTQTSLSGYTYRYVF